ncbi:hypothetical protein [Streptosporangium saharense]|uniref:hypothetical protein n=1 Tax=Streptosporangium saharense TaxID=1706840 RepID=UPI003416D485
MTPHRAGTAEPGGGRGQGHGPTRGLALLDDLNRRFQLDRDPLVRQREHAARLYREAASLTGDQIERRHLLARADHLD